MPISLPTDTVMGIIYLRTMVSMLFCRIKGCNHLCPCVCELGAEVGRIWEVSLNAAHCAGLLYEDNTMEITIVGATDDEFRELGRKLMRARVGGCDGKCRVSKSRRPKLQSHDATQPYLALYAGT